MEGSSLPRCFLPIKKEQDPVLSKLIRRVLTPSFCNSSLRGVPISPVPASALSSLQVRPEIAEWPCPGLLAPGKEPQQC